MFFENYFSYLKFLLESSINGKELSEAVGAINFASIFHLINDDEESLLRSLLRSEINRIYF